MRERRKEPREGSEIEPETACIQTVGAPPSSALRVEAVQKTEDGRQKAESCCRYAALLKRSGEATQQSVLCYLLSVLCPSFKSRAFEGGVTAYLLYNGSATYVQ